MKYVKWKGWMENETEFYYGKFIEQAECGAMIKFTKNYNGPDPFIPRDGRIWCAFPQEIEEISEEEYIVGAIIGS